MPSLRSLTSFALLFVAAPAVAAEPQPAPTELNVRLSPGERALSGIERVEVTNSSQKPLDRVDFWLYANRFADRSPELTDVNFFWVYPERFDPGFMRLSSVKVDGHAAAFRDAPHPDAGRQTLTEVVLPAPLPPGGRVTVELAFATALPERYGGFGCVDGGCTLFGGFYPMLASQDANGWDVAAAPARSRFTGTLVLDGAPATAVVAGTVADGPVVAIDVPDAPYLALAVAPEWHTVTRPHAGATLVYLDRDAPPPAGDAAKQIIPYTQEDRAAMVLDAGERALDALAAAGAPVPLGTQVTLVMVPLRLELASGQPGMIGVSNHLYEVLPVERARKFHERELVRAIFTSLLAARDAGLPARERDRAPEAAAAYLTDIYTLTAWQKSESGQEILSPVAFVPTVDTLIYAPQVAFADAYFGGVADPDRFRDDPRRFSSQRPRGSLFYEKLRDLLPPAQVAEVMKRLIAGGQSLPAAAGQDEAFFRQWSGAYPRVDYRIGGKKKVREADGWRHEITILKVTPAGSPPGVPTEPVEVRVVDGDGETHDLRWDGAGDRGVVAFVAKSDEISSVEIDPRDRLIEAVPDGEHDDPRYDDRSPPKFKLLYNGLGVALNLTASTVTLLLDFTLRRVRDVHNSFRFQLFNSSATTIGLFAGYNHEFGPMVTPASVAAALSFGLTVSRLKSGFADAPSAGTRVSIAAAIGYDDRDFLFDPLHARGFSLGARYSVTAFDAGGGLLQTASLFADATAIATPWDGHTIVANVEGAVVAGDLSSRAGLLIAGGDLRGYGPSELFGRARLTGHLEWRGNFRHDLDWNFGHTIYLRSIGAAAFVDAGGISSCDRYGDVVDASNLFASVGFGLRLHYDDLGVQPGMMALDVAVPLVVHERTCFGTSDLQLAGRPPVMLYLTFLPPF